MNKPNAQYRNSPVPVRRSRGPWVAVVLVLLLITGCFASPFIFYALLQIDAVNEWATDRITAGMTEENRKNNQRLRQRREATARQIVDDRSLSDEAALRQLATATFNDEHSGTWEELLTFSASKNDQGNWDVSIVLRQDNSEEEVSILRASVETPGQRDARRDIETGEVLLRTGHFVAYGRQRRLGKVEVTLRSRVFLDDENRDYFDLFQFTISPEKFDDLVALTTIPDEKLQWIDVNEAAEVWTIQLDSYDEVVAEVRISASQ